MTGRRSFWGMAILSGLTLAAGLVRELVIAGQLQASGEADAFFRGMVVVGLSRGFTVAVLRARWLVAEGVPAVLLRAERGTLAGIGIAALGVLFAMLGDADPWVLAAFAVTVLAGVAGAVPRVLAERSGAELWTFALDPLLPLSTIAGALTLGRGLLGPAVGLALGAVLQASLVLLAPRDRAPSRARDLGGHTPYLLADTLLYVNLGWVDAALSRALYAPGAFARLNYAFMFVNAILAIPTASASVLALRASLGPERSLRRWAALAGAGASAALATIAIVLATPPCTEALRTLTGWSLADATRPLLWASVPFVGLRLANTIGRTLCLTRAPRRLVGWDALGLAARMGMLLLLAPHLGVAASIAAMTVAEAVQLLAWARGPERRQT